MKFGLFWKIIFSPVLGIVETRGGGGGSGAVAEPETTLDEGADRESAGDDTADVLAALGVDDAEVADAVDPEGAEMPEVDAVDEDAEASGEEAEAEAESDEDEEADDEEEPEEAEDDSEESEEDDAEKADGTKGLYRDLKKTRKRAQEAEARVQELEAQVASVDTVRAELEALRAERVVPAPTEQDPLPGVMDAKELDGLQSFATQLQDWTEDNPEGGTCPLLTDKDGSPRELDADAVRAIRAQTRRDLRAIPGRRAYLEQFAQTEKVLADAFPEVADPKSELSLRLNTIISSIPEVKRKPGYKLAALYYDLGRQVIEAKGREALSFVKTLKTAPKKPKAKPEKVVPVAPRKPSALRTPATVRQSRGETRRRSEIPATREDAAAGINVDGEY